MGVVDALGPVSLVIDAHADCDARQGMAVQCRDTGWGYHGVTWRAGAVGRRRCGTQSPWRHHNDARQLCAMTHTVTLPEDFPKTSAHL